MALSSQWFGQFYLDIRTFRVYPPGKMEDNMASIIKRILAKMDEVSQPQQKFLLPLFVTIVVMRGKVNFRNLSRYSDVNEKTYSRQFRKLFDFVSFNQYLIEEAVETTHEQIGIMDCSYVPKSGKQTYGLDIFYDSCKNQPAKGLEVSNLVVIDVTDNTGYTLSSRQTPSQEALEKMVADGDITPTSQIEDDEITRIDFYATHLTEDSSHLPQEVRYIVADGYYAKTKFVTAVHHVNRHLISKLRCDANLRYLYTGPQKKKGARRKYDGKVKFDDTSRLEYVAQVEPGLHLYTAIVNNVQLKCNIRLVYVQNLRNRQKPGYALLFSTDINQDAITIYRYYKARFQIEFLFRDAKQFTGLSDCQARCQDSLDFHFNASFTTLNLAKVDAQQNFGLLPNTPFSMATQKRVYFNEHLLQRFIAVLALDPTLVINNPELQQLTMYGAIAA